MKHLKILIIIAITLTFVNCSEDTLEFKGVGKITGKVVRAKSFEPIKNAKVVLTPSNNSVFTDDNGNFIIENVETGEYSISATKEGLQTSYDPVKITTGSEVNIIIEMDIATASNRPPTTPKLISPKDNSTDHNLVVELNWQSEDPDKDSIAYKLKIKNDLNNNIEIIDKLTDTTYVLTKLAYSTKYFWQVSATDSINPEVWSSISSFETMDNNQNRFLYVRKDKKSNNNIIYSSTRSGDSIKITKSSTNSWRPRKSLSANLIAYLRTDNFETHLYTMNLDGTNPFKVTTIPVEGFRQSELDFSWSQNGAYLIYPNFDKLYKINKDGSGLELLYKTPDGSFISECDWSYDGKSIALKTNNQNGYNSSIYIIDMNGNKITDVLTNVKGAVGGINLSVNGKELLYTHDVSEYEDVNYRQLNTKIFLYDLDKKSTTDLSTNKPNGNLYLDPRFSPNNAEIIFVNTSNDGVSERNIYTLEIDDVSNKERKLLFKNAVMPDWE